MKLFKCLLAFTLLLCSSVFSQPSQTTNTIVMISPDTFGFNEQTATTNVFENQPDSGEKDLQIQALKEFQDTVETLRDHQINVIVLPSRKDVVTPDAVFPNNWFSTEKEEKRSLILFPMLNENRRLERQPELVTTLENAGFSIDNIIDLTFYEKQGLPLEGTGCLVLDRVNKRAYASLSPRINMEVLQEFCRKFHYQPVIFKSYANNCPIFHTNVMMSVGTKFAVVCFDSVPDEKEKALIEKELKTTEKKIISININQVNHMCGNILELKTVKGTPTILMSNEAYTHFTNEQIQELESYGELIVVKIPTIERIGGGSARCMVAEIF